MPRIIMAFLAVSVLAACADKNIPLSPAWPVAGPKVAAELDRIPYRGWPELEALRLQIPELQAQYACPPLSDLVSLDTDGQNPAPLAPTPCLHTSLAKWLEDMKLQLDAIRPSTGFEHLWEWLARLEKLKRQLATDR